MRLLLAAFAAALRCATVSGVVERCGGPAPGPCSMLRVGSVSLLDASGAPAEAQYPGSGRTMSRFFFVAEVPGSYVLQTKAGALVLRRTVQLRAGHPVRADLIAQIH